MLELKNITKKYEVGTFKQTALDGVSVMFRSKEFVSIVGPSGSGKTTLLNMVGGLDRYDNGDLLIDNKSTLHFKDQDWDSYRNHTVGFIFQNYNLITHISVLENVEVGLTLSGLSQDERKKRALEVLTKVGLEAHINKRPNQLSGGQQQRVAIARALANNPDIILADEPTGAIDTETSNQIMGLIKEIAQDKLVILVTHDESIAREYSDRLITLRDGKIVEDSHPYNVEQDKTTHLSLKKTYMTFKQALKLSFNNLRTKKIRTLITAFAGSIGIIGIALVISLANGLNIEVDNLERSTLAELPIQVDPVPIDVDSIQRGRPSDEDDIDNTYEKFPELAQIFPYSVTLPEDLKINNITNDYVDYVYELDDDLFYEISVRRSVRFKVIKQFDDNQTVSLNMVNAGFKQIISKNDTFEGSYDLLEGTYPSNQNELLLVVDEYNRLDVDILNALGLDGDVEAYNFDDFIGMTFKVILIDDYYELDDSTNRYKTVDDLNGLYESSVGIPITITGIARSKDEALFTILDEGIKYHPDLLETYLNHAKNSDIGEAQVNSNVSVFTGLAIDEATKIDLLSRLGVDDTPRQVRIYPKDFESKEEITKYLDLYNVGLSEEETIQYTDLAAVVTELTGDLINGVSYVLIAFSAISLIVSSIMIGIITYVSVLERTKEIGILRSLGARKRDISRVFNAETTIIGFVAGSLGVFLAYLLTFPINFIIGKYAEELDNIAKLPLYAIFGLVTISIILTFIAGLIPSSIASRKNPVDALRVD